VAVTEHAHPSAAQPDTFESRGATYRLEILRGAELFRLLPLFHDAFGEGDFSEEWLARKYACEAGGLEALACAAFTDDGEPAGSVGLLPWTVRHGDVAEAAGQMVDVMTGGAHRGRGLFVRLADRVREVCEEAGVGFLYGFPNEAAYPIWVGKLGYERLQNLVEYRRPVRTLWAERAAQRLGPVDRLYRRHVDRALRRAEAGDAVLENSLVRDGFAGVTRDGAFHRYKSAFGGSRLVAVDGGRAWVKLRHGLLLGDLEAESDADLERTVSSLQRLARRLGVHQLVFQTSAETRFAPVLARRFRTLPGLPVIYRSLGSAIPKERLRFTFGDFDNF
jgi:hypothetical protein